MPPRTRGMKKEAGTSAEGGEVKPEDTLEGARSFGFRADKLGDDAFGTGGEDVLCVERKESIE